MGAQRSTGHNDHLLATCLYVEHVAAHATEAWNRLAAGEDVLRVLQEQFHMVNLPAVHIARFLHAGQVVRQLDPMKG